jgi:uncharacterized membrane protein required for colicin V production
VDFGEFIGSLTTFDLVVFLFFFGFFVLGFAQGTLRRLLGLGAVLFSFLFAANLRDPLGAFLADNWTQFPSEYAYMVGFLTIFVAASVAFAITIQTFYKTQPLFEKARFVDEAIGGILGLVQAALYLAIAIIILDSFFLIPGIPESGNELHFLRDFWEWMNDAQVTAFFRESILPIFFGILGIFIPDDIEQLVLGNQI